MSLNIQNNVAMPQNQMAFKGGKLKLYNVMKSFEEKGGKFPPFILQNTKYTPNLERAREEFIHQFELALKDFENSEVGKVLKSITDRFNKNEITAEEAQKMIQKQLEIIG